MSDLDFEDVIVETVPNEGELDDIYIDGAKMSSVDLEDNGLAEEKKEIKPPSVPHPISVFFHLFFKVAAVIVYFVVAWMSGSFTLVFILVILCMMADFWTVKNVTGRLLVGMRYWNEVREDGSNEWFFESLEGQRKISKIEAAIFWVALLGFPIVWVLLTILAVFEFDVLYLVITLIAFILCCPNIYGYLRCAKGKKKNTIIFFFFYFIKFCSYFLVSLF